MSNLYKYFWDIFLVFCIENMQSMTILQIDPEKIGVYLGEIIILLTALVRFFRDVFPSKKKEPVSPKPPVKPVEPPENIESYPT